MKTCLCRFVYPLQEHRINKIIILFVCSLFNNIVSNSDHITHSAIRRQWMVNWKQCEKKWYYPGRTRHRCTTEQPLRASNCSLNLQFYHSLRILHNAVVHWTGAHKYRGNAPKLNYQLMNSVYIITYLIKSIKSISVNSNFTVHMS
jgi:hypothetical protein